MSQEQEETVKATVWYFPTAKQTVDSMLRILLGDDYMHSDKKVEITMKVIEPKKPC